MTDIDVTDDRLWEMVRVYRTDTGIFVRVFGQQTPTSLGDITVKLTERQARQLGKQLLSGNAGRPKDQQDTGPVGPAVQTDTTPVDPAAVVPVVDPGAQGT